jgi:hypothetical protein
VHAALLVSLWVFGRAQRVNFVAFVGYLVLQGLSFHPNYAVVAGEIAVLPLVLGLHTWPPSSRFSPLRFSRSVPSINRSGIFAMRQMPSEAEHAGRGIWTGSYVEPWPYRVCVRAGGIPTNCSDDANAHPR